MAVLGYLPKLKRGPGMHFYAWFSYKNVFYLKYYIIDKVSFSRYQTKCVIKFLLNFMIYIRSSSKVTADRWKKRGRWKYKSSNFLWTERGF